MPRIDPIKLLNCLSVLLLPNGGIKGTVEVTRLAEMMTKYSKKLVSKCIYIQILKYTETALLDLFMASDGWSLVHIWLTESIVGKNWPLVKELLELLLLCPVDIDRLKTNNCPKLVKELSKDENHYAIKALASKLVEQWLKTVKGEQPKPILISDIQKIISDINNEVKNEVSKDVIESNKTDKKLPNEINVHNNEGEEIKNKNNLNIEKLNDTPDEKDESNKESETLPVLKITLKNGKQILTQVDDESKPSEHSEDKTDIKENIKNKSKEKTNERRRSSDSSKSSSSSSRHSSKSKSSSDRHHTHKDSSSKYSSSSTNSKDKKRDKDRHSSSSHSSKSKSSSSSTSSSKKISSSSSSKSKEDRNSQKTSTEKEKSKEKEKNLADKEKPKDSEIKSQSPSIHKLGKIPKLSDVKREKPSISIEVRKPEDPKPKTVKTFHSKFRKHGLEEEIQPPPSRASVLTKKQLPPLPPTVSIPIPKRPSPVHNESPPEKKPKTMDIDKPGAIKLIPPKPKRCKCCRHYIKPEFELYCSKTVCDLTRLRWIHQQFSEPTRGLVKGHLGQHVSDEIKTAFDGEGSKL